MTIRKATLGACLLLTCSAFGARTYKTKPGDTVAGVADKLGVSQKALIQANDLGNRKKLKAGKVLTVPSSSKAHHEVSLHKSAGSYVVRNGDCDWTVAHKFGLTVPQLKALNPGVDLSNLTIGHSLHVPGHGGSSSAVASKTSHKAVHASATYTVQEDDNDWIIAKNVGVSTKVLRELNPSVKWGSIQPGQKLHIPGSGSSTVASKIPVIHTRHAFIAKDDVVLRRGPSTNSELIVTVDSGVPVTVIDREGNWYKLHFPKGTEAWVRGDNLKPAATQVAEHHHSSKVASRETSHSSIKRNARIAYLQHMERLARQQAHSKNVAMRRAARQKLAQIHETRVAEHLPATSDDLVADARGWIGTPYNYGSMSRSATDCSGFVGQIMKRHGVKLPRTSLEQSHTGQSVSKGELKEGDLVFFRTRGSGRVSHVGMYVGNGNFIHASSGGGQVMVSSLSDGYYSKRFAGAKRVIKHKAKTEVAKPKTDEVKAKDEDGDNDKPTNLPIKE